MVGVTLQFWDTGGNKVHVCVCVLLVPREIVFQGPLCFPKWTLEIAVASHGNMEKNDGSSPIRHGLTIETNTKPESPIKIILVDLTSIPEKKGIVRS